jgi:hypothetical protein
MATKKKPAKEAPVFDKAALITAAKEFGTTPEFMAGALTGTKEPITREQAKDKLDEFMARPIK